MGIFLSVLSMTFLSGGILLQGWNCLSVLSGNLFATCWRLTFFHTGKLISFANLGGGRDLLKKMYNYNLIEI